MKQIERNRRSIWYLVLTAALTLAAALPAFAGEWKAEGDLYRYVEEDGSYAVGVWIPAEDGSAWYYADENGTLALNRWVVEDVYNWYWVKPDGRMAQNEWVFDGTDWFYAGDSGLMSTGWQEIDGTWYFFFDDYRMAHDITVDGYEVNHDGAWVTE